MTIYRFVFISLSVIALEGCVDGATILGQPVYSPDTGTREGSHSDSMDRIDRAVDNQLAEDAALNSGQANNEVDAYLEDSGRLGDATDDDLDWEVDGGVDASNSQAEDMSLGQSTETTLLCPTGSVSGICVFGSTTRQLEVSPDFQNLATQVVTMQGRLTIEQEMRVLFGFECDGNFRPNSFVEALDLTDDGIHFRRIMHRPTGLLYEWYRFYMGDTEVGFIFAGQTGRLVALIGDQDIHSCQISAGP